jgi:NADPH-dependent glutamate synthase beta chain and related oxidoreductases
VAVVGAGPAGLFAVQSLLASAPALGIDVFDRLPAPYGLVRYGVAPDNQKIKSVTRALRTAFDPGNRVRFIGNVRFGTDIRRADLLEHYDAVVYATGAQGERRLGIPGEELPGSHGAKDFVEWYSGHPDAAEREFALDAPTVAVVGAGNVALDVARMLVRGSDEIASTDVPDRVLDTFRKSRVTDVYLIARRGLIHAKFTAEELRGLNDLPNADVLVRPEEVSLGEEEEALVASNRQLRTNVMMLREWAQRPSRGKARRIHIRFLRSPVRILGDRRVAGVVLERNEPLAGGGVRGTGDMETIELGMIFRSVGYRGLPLPDVPFDEAHAIIPHREGRVLDENDQPAKGEYVTGWAKRGPSGVIGTNKSDSAETVSNLLADLGRSAWYKGSDPARLLALLDRRGVQYTHWENWLRLDAHEIELGRMQNRPRVKIPALRSMLELSRGAQ